jgi:GAF domain-containing protein
VPLRKDKVLLGVITAVRREVRAFSDKQIALLENFAAQAVIAMENARLLTETREALEKQTATAEVLQVINSSPGELAPVFEAIATAATPLCDAANCAVFRFDGSLIHLTAQYGLTAAQLGTLRDTFPLPPGRGSVTARAIMTRQVVHVPDLTADVEFAHPSLVEAGLRGSVSVPMLREGVAIGAITVTRQESRSFSDKQIALLENFAAQAVIAMENARLLTETREALDQQTATAEVLGLINSSPGDLAPVFEIMLERAMHLCGASFGMLHTYEGDQFLGVAARGVPPAFAEYLANNPLQPRPGTFGARILSGELLVHVTDVADDELYRSGDPQRRALVELGGARTTMLVALIKDRALLGTIQLYRQHVQPFSEKQVALLQNFAAQAVIAMENARLINETREALEQQTATAEVRQVINSPPGDLAPVFDAILEKAHSLCGADHGSLFLKDGEIFRAIASRGMPEAMTGLLREGIPANESPLAQPLMGGEPFVHVHDSALDKHPNWIKQALDGQQPPHAAVHTAPEERRTAWNDCSGPI